MHWTIAATYSPVHLSVISATTVLSSV